MLDLLKGISINYLLKKEFDIVYCSNVFIHLNDVIKPLREIIRVAKKNVIIRTVLFDVSYKIQLVYNNKWWSDTNVKPVMNLMLMESPEHILTLIFYHLIILKKILKNSPKS